MTHDLVWGWSIIIHLFLVSLGAGTLIVSAVLLLRGGDERADRSDFRIARIAAFIAPVPVMIDGLILISELGSFQAGYWFKWLNLYKTIIFTAPMSVGLWLLTAFICVSLLYAATFVFADATPGNVWHGRRKVLAWVGVPLGIAAALYPGFLLATMQARPLWNTPLLPLLFLLSSLSVGIAVATLLRAILRTKAPPSAGETVHQRGAYAMAATDVMLIGGQLLLIILFLLFGHLSVGSVTHAMQIILPGGQMGSLFWIWVVLIGLLTPGLIELSYLLPKLRERGEFSLPTALQLAVPLTVFVGAFMLRYVLTIAGQITGATGI